VSIEALTRAGRIVGAEVDGVAALALLERAKRHLGTAERELDLDPDGAYSLLYDAARKAVTAHMLVSGWRVRSGRPGAHESVALYAEAALGTGAHGGDVRELDRMRRTRNRVEYGEWGGFGAAEIHADLRRARAIVAAVEAAWPATD
jgi:hypothetical protein